MRFGELRRYRLRSLRRGRARRVQRRRPRLQPRRRVDQPSAFSDGQRPQALDPADDGGERRIDVEQSLANRCSGRCRWRGARLEFGHARGIVAPGAADQFDASDDDGQRRGDLDDELRDKPRDQNRITLREAAGHRPGDDGTGDDDQPRETDEQDDDRAAARSLGQVGHGGAVTFARAVGRPV
jgi:hypothetical protein